jgi:arabinan endo-1,5-alpha-L-arabinosidase
LEEPLRRKLVRHQACGVLLLLAACCAGGWPQADDAPAAFAVSGDVRGTHDPAIAKDGDTYYVFATGVLAAGAAAGTDRARLPQLPVRCSKDLRVWRRCGAVFAEMPAWIRALSPQTKELWAPDVSYFAGEFHLYYAFSVFGKNTSGIGLATNKTLDPASPQYRWVDRGLVLRSGLADDFNAIDPNVVLDGGKAWLAFGSFWTGVKMRKLDERTGLLSHEDSRTYALASRDAHMAGPRDPDLPPDNEAIEAPFVFAHDGWFYLFVSWDLCCRGVKSTYQERVGRSRSVTGPYLDREGKPMLRGGGTQVLAANAAWVGPGGASLLHLPESDVMVFHAYGAKDGGASLQVASVVWKEGWPVVEWGLAPHP